MGPVDDGRDESYHIEADVGMSITSSSDASPLLELPQRPTTKKANYLAEARRMAAPPPGASHSL